MSPSIPATRPVTKTRIACACLIAAAVGLPAYRAHVVETTIWTPLDVPFPLTPSLIPPHEFTIDRTGTYEVVLRVRNAHDPQRRALSDCLAGWDRGHARWGPSAFGEPCRVPPVVAFRWRLVSFDGRKVDAGVVEGVADAGGFSVEDSFRPVAVFSANRGERYRLDGETSLDAGRLAFADPRILVQPTGSTNEDEMVITLGYWAAALAAGFGALGLLVRDLWAAWRRAA